MNIVEMLSLSVSPFALDIIDIESTVRRDPFWLDRTKVVTEDEGFGELVCKVYTPDSGAATKIEYTLRLIMLEQRGAEQSTVEN